VELIYSSTASLTISYEHISDRTTVVTVVGDVDVYKAPTLREALVEILEQGRSRLIIDLEGVEFVDSTGLGVLVGALKRTRAREGDVALVSPSGPIRKGLRITGLSRVFPVFGSVPQAEEELELWSVLGTELGRIRRWAAVAGVADGTTDAARGLQAKLAAETPQHGQAGCPGLTIDRDAASGQVTVLTLGGWLDTHSAPELRSEFVTLIDQGRRLLVADLIGVTRLDSVGMGVLVGGLKRLRNAGGSMGVALAESPVLEFLRCCGLTRVFAIHDTSAAAVQRLNA